MKVKVRMYCQGLGDCFLLQFPKAGGGTFHMMIDCGVLTGEAKGSEKMNDVVEHIRETCKGVLDLVVITHEHMDHLSGFNQARKIFETIVIRQLWLGWTEIPGDNLAEQLMSKKKKRTESIENALKLMGQNPHVDTINHAKELDEFLSDFLGAASEVEEADASGKPKRKKGRLGTNDALKWVREHAKKETCWEPGKQIQLPEVPGVKFYVLGPPRDKDLIHQDYTKADTYMGLDALALEDLFANRDYDSIDEDLLEEPFDRCYGIPYDHAEVHPFFLSTYFESQEDWRRVDGDWFGFVDQLALQMDHDVNNTSLALAIELPNKEVLLFPGDAQVGNWRSWASFKTNNKNDANFDVVDLLERTVFYKVGHHGSHNATIREPGLENMTNKKLVAFIPVNRKTAAKQGKTDKVTGKKKGWEMPAKKLWERLKEQTQDRIFLADDLEGAKKQIPNLPKGVSVEVIGKLAIEWQVEA